MKIVRQTYLNLPVQVARMARMAAARAGVSLSEYVTGLVARDAQESGIADLLGGDQHAGLKLPTVENDQGGKDNA